MLSGMHRLGGQVARWSWHDHLYPVISNWGALRIGQTVKIFMGAGWLKGTVRTKFTDSVVIQLDRRTARCYDLRNIKE